MSLVVELHLRARRGDGRRVSSRQLFSLVAFDDSVTSLFDDVIDWFEPRGYAGLHLCKWYASGSESPKQFQARIRRDLRRVAQWLHHQSPPAYREAVRAGLSLDLFLGIELKNEAEWHVHLGAELLSACRRLGLSITTNTTRSWSAEPGATADGGT
jgi:hypothetical protein